MATPVLLASTDAEGKAILAKLPEERRANVAVGTPEQAATALRPYLDAGFTGFTFNNTVLGTPERIGLAGELLRLVS
jgi:alkanesulfonate monooxygenase SsuD/methylene tetrahydromethanopterin reductase-like flavin-dependent oxidoreductase (luciferase family)